MDQGLCFQLRYTLTYTQNRERNIYVHSITFELLNMIRLVVAKEMQTHT